MKKFFCLLIFNLLSLSLIVNFLQVNSYMYNQTIKPNSVINVEIVSPDGELKVALPNYTYIFQQQVEQETILDMILQLIVNVILNQ